MVSCLFPPYYSLRSAFRFIVHPTTVLFLCLYFSLILHYIPSYLSCTLYFSPGMFLCIKPAMPTGLCTTIIIIHLSLYLLLSTFGLLLYPKSMVVHMEDVTLQPYFMFNSFSHHVQIGCIYDIIFDLLPVCLCTHSLFCMLLKI